MHDTCVICHQPGGWSFTPHGGGGGRAHTDCLGRLGADVLPSFEDLQSAERRLYRIGEAFRDSCGRMASSVYEGTNGRKFHIAGTDYHFASWSSFLAWLDSAEAYHDHINAPVESDWD